MKKIITIALAVLIGAAFITTVFAQDKPAAAPEKKPAATAEKAVKTEKPAATEEKAAKPEKAAKKKDSKVFAGQITKIDAGQKTITAKDKRGEVTLDVTDAKYVKGLKFEDLKEGDKIFVKFEEKDGKMVAMKIGKAGKKAKAAKKEAKPEEKPAPAPAPAK